MCTSNQKHSFMSVHSLHNKIADFQNRTTGSKILLFMPLNDAGGNRAGVRPCTAGALSAVLVVSAVISVFFLSSPSSAFCFLPFFFYSLDSEDRRFQKCLSLARSHLSLFCFYPQTEVHVTS